MGQVLSTEIQGCLPRIQPGELPQAWKIMSDRVCRRVGLSAYNGGYLQWFGILPLSKGKILIKKSGYIFGKSLL